MTLPPWFSVIGFANPWLLLALAALPAIWWLVRAIPPAPRRQTFPAIRLLFDLNPAEETPARTPWWLLLLRLAAAALIILALAQPLVNPADDLPGDGPLVMIVDDGWASAPDWQRVQAVWVATAEQAGRAGRSVMILPTAPRDPATGPTPIGPMPAAEAAALASRWQPVPWPTDRDAAWSAWTEAWAGLENAPERAGFVWLSDGTADPATSTLMEALNRRADGLRVHRPAGLPLLVRASIQGGEPTARVTRGTDGADRPVTVRLVAADGRTLARTSGVLPRGETVVDLAFDVPAALANEARSLRLGDADHAGAVALLDQGWRRQTVGIVAGESDAAQPLLTETHYLTRALQGVAAVRTGPLDRLLDEGEVSVILLPDQGTLSAAVTADLVDWVDRGGLLLRFAGPLLAASEAGQPGVGGGAPALVPTALRLGDRALSGALSWSEPAALGAFPENSPLAGLPVPADVRVTRQVLARPGLDLAERTWAVLEDGTPLITADRRGAGRIVLVHTTADPRWSNLALSGLFIEVLDRILAQAGRMGGLPEGDAALPPVAVLDGSGALTAPGPMVTGIPARAFLETQPGPRHPPGLYGPPDAPRALALGDRLSAPIPMTGLPDRARLMGYGAASETPLAPWLLAAALLLLLTDAVATLAMRGLLRMPTLRRARPTALVLAAALAFLVPSSEAAAQELRLAGDLSLMDQANGLWLAHVMTGDPMVDDIAQQGLEGLSYMLNARTAVEPTGAVGVDVEEDDLALFPLLYWPISQRQNPPSPAAVSRIDEYLRNGGVILFDTRDQNATGAAPLTGAGPGVRHLRAIAGNLDIPPLTPIGPDHVLTKAFYLLDTFPGRYAGGTVWVATPEVTQNDGVSPVVLGSHDWAAAWAIGEGGQAALPINGPDPWRQRELAIRFGVNLVMYALTGNYKADQVHVPAILERLGQ